MLGGIIFSHAQTNPTQNSPSENPSQHIQETARQQILKQTNIQILDSLAKTWKEQAEAERAIAHRVANEKGWPILQEDREGNVIELIRLDETGMPEYYITDNLNAARTLSTDEVWAGGSVGTSLSGSGLTIGIWDGGGVRLTHQELTGSATQIDVPSNSLSDHATHVAGTMVASGINPSAKGMAYQASIDCHDWNSDQSEMATAAASGLLISNHSYGRIRGWGSGSVPNWYGTVSVDSVEDYQFGFYGSLTRDWDILAENAPYYLIVKSAGNDRNDVHTGTHNVYINGNWVQSADFREQDGGTDGYDCVGLRGVAKNILTVGAVSDISGGYSSPSDVNMSSFSGWGPTDDGRIKPDIVGNGISLFSSSSAGNSSYNSKSGTSMSSPNVSGSLLLLQEHYANLNTVFIRAATLKALALHTADEAGPAEGPDYQHGWGLMNTEKAVRHISNANGTSGEDLILEETLNDGETYTFHQIYSDGSTPIRATLVWTDPAAIANSPDLNPTTIKLVNDLDVRIIGDTTYLPYILDPANPSAAATQGDNIRDNVEQVYIANPPAGFYTVQVSHKGSLASAQDFSLMISASDSTPSLTLLSPISCGNLVGGTTIGGSSSFDFYSCVSWDETGPEHIYPLSLNNTREITASLLGLAPGDELDVFLLSANGSCLAFADSSLTYTADPGSYYVVVDGPLGNSGAYALDISCLIPACTTIPIACGDTVNNTTIGGAYLNSEYGCATWNESGPEVVYELTLADSSDISASLSNLSVDLDVFLISSCDSAIASCLAHNDNALTYPNAAPGTYYIIVDGLDGAAGSFTLDVQAVPSISFPSVPSVCEDAMPIQLAASPAGGVYSGPGISGNLFDPVLAGSGTHQISYSFTNLDGCSNSSLTSIIVHELPSVSMPSLAPVCEDETPIQLAGSPAGGMYSGPGINVDTFDPLVAGSGTHQISYTFTDTSGCTSSLTENIIVHALPNQPGIDILGNLFRSSESGDSYQWYLNGMILTDSTSQSIVVSDSGYYQVEVVDENGCSSRSDSLLFPATVGIEHVFPDASLSLYPNPSEGTVFIAVENFPIHEGLDISVHDMHGRRIIHETWTQSGSFVNALNLTSHAKGIYLIRISYLGTVGLEQKVILR